MKILSIRMVDFWVFLLCLALLVTGLYLEVAYKLVPCPLCILQRIIFILLGLLFLIGCSINPNTRVRRYYHWFIVVIALMGAAVAGRQVWLQHLPLNQLPSCGANLKYLFEILPINQAVLLLFKGTGECAKVTWRFLGLSIADLSLMAFIFLTGLASWQALRKEYN